MDKPTFTPEQVAWLEENLPRGPFSRLDLKPKPETTPPNTEEPAPTP